VHNKPVRAEDVPREGVAVSASTKGSTCAYVSSVNPTLEWPGRCEMTLTSCQPVALRRPTLA
jgi:hypothetical protein